MATRLPVPMRFELPDGWQSVHPDEVGAPGAAFVALHLATKGAGFTANITVDGEFRAGGLTEMAEESVRQIDAAARTVTVANRREIGPPEAPGLAQDLQVIADVRGVDRKIVQCQVYLTLGRSSDQLRSAVVRAVLTCADEQVATVIDDFRAFVGTLTVDPAP